MQNLNLQALVHSVSQNDEFVIGMRVVRGPDWKWDNKDVVNGEHVEGLIISEIDPNKWVEVQWDSGNKLKCRVGAENGQFDIVLSPNADAVKQLTTFGSRVVRGPDWKYDVQDGDGSGRVIGPVAGEPGWVEVQWDNGNHGKYRIGADQGKFDIVVED